MKGERNIFQLLLLVVCSFHLTEMMPVGGHLYRLLYQVDTEHGLLTLRCERDFDRVAISDVTFWLNRTSVEDTDIRNRTDVQVTNISTYNLTINFTRGNEGDFSCGIATWTIGESEKKALVNTQGEAQVKDPLNTTITATVGESTILQCPISIGAYREHYSVEWFMDGTKIAYLIGYQTFNAINPRYDINRNDFSLVIDPVQINDTSTGYLCRVTVTNPRSQMRQSVTELRTDTDVSISLWIQDKPIISPRTVIKRQHNERPSLTCSVNYTGPHAPNITWTYVKSETEFELTEEKYESESMCIEQGDSVATKHSTLHSVNLDVPVEESVIVRCKVVDGPTTDAYLVMAGQDPSGTCENKSSIEVTASCTCH